MLISVVDDKFMQLFGRQHSQHLQDLACTSKPWYIGILRVGILFLWWVLLLLHLLDLPLHDLIKHFLDLLEAISGGTNSRGRVLSMMMSLRILMIFQAQTTHTGLLQWS